jgi:hypothetical protein
MLVVAVGLLEAQLLERVEQEAVEMVAIHLPLVLPEQRILEVAVVALGLIRGVVEPEVLALFS